MNRLFHTYCSILGIGLVLFLYSCAPNREVLPTSPIGLSYFPLKTGSYIEYEVESIIYFSDLNYDSSSYYLKEVVEDTFYTSDGTLHFVINTFKKSSLNEAYVIDSVFDYYTTKNYAVTKRSNRSIIPLSFPMEDFKTWNGNAINTSEKDEFQYEYTGKLYAISKSLPYTEDVIYAYHESIPSGIPNSLRFPKASLVYRENQKADAVVGKFVHKELYAENIGLVYELKHKYEIGQNPSDPQGFEKIINGSFYKRRLLDYGMQ